MLPYIKKKSNGFHAVRYTDFDIDKKRVLVLYLQSADTVSWEARICIKTERKSWIVSWLIRTTLYLDIMLYSFMI